MTYQTCKTCKYYDTGSHHKCVAPLVSYGYGKVPKDVRQKGLHVEDDEGWGMIPGPDFGCILHEGKE